ncbi:MAG: choice-of-anchor B family protein [Chitinophagales bacterium]
MKICVLRNCSLLILLTFLFSDLSAQYNLSLSANFTYPASYEMSGCWGYTDSTGNEYAIIGTSEGTSILDVTIPAVPEELFFIDGETNIWREAKVWNNHAYISTEAAGSGMLIIDLNNLPLSIDTITFKGDSIHPFNTAHTIFIDENGICYLFGYNVLIGANEGAFIVDLNPDPMHPVYLGEFTGNYIHDGFARNDTLWAAEIYQGKFEALDISDKSDIVLIGTQNTGALATHNCWLSDDGKYLFTTDETPLGFIESYDVSDVTDIKKLDAVKHGASTSTIAHNTYYLNSYIVTAHYSEGVSIHDVNQPDNMIEVAHYDTTPGGLSGFEGVWGVYPYFNSQTIIATDRMGGVFILHPEYERACYLQGFVTNATTLANIFNAKIKIISTPAVDSTDLLGEYKTGYFQSGLYDIEISAAGCATKIFNDIVLDHGETTTLNAALDCWQLGIETSNIHIEFDAFYISAEQTIQINYDLTAAAGLDIRLINSMGQIIQSEKMDAHGETIFPAQNLIPGIYFIEIGNASKKVMVY